MRRPVLITSVLIAVVVLAVAGFAYNGHRRGPGTANCRTTRQDSTTAIRDAATIQRKPIPDQRGLTGAALAKAPWQAGTPAYDRATQAKTGQAAARARFAANVVREDPKCFTVRERARADTQLGILDSSRGR
jgi:hypothetical protein